MRKIKLCGLTRMCDIEMANKLMPDYIGFVFWPKSKRNLLPDQALELKKKLNSQIQAVGVFVSEEIEKVAYLANHDIIDVVQLHGQEDEAYMQKLRQMVSCPIIQAFRIDTKADVERACRSTADYILLDAGKGGGTVFDWSLLKEIDRPYFLAGGLNTENITDAIRTYHPFGVDVSSGIETDGVKDPQKMEIFVEAVRKEEQ